MRDVSESLHDALVVTGLDVHARVQIRLQPRLAEFKHLLNKMANISEIQSLETEIDHPEYKPAEFKHLLGKMTKISNSD